MADLPMTAPQILDEAMARGLASENAMKAIVVELFGEEGLTQIRALAKPDQQVACAEMLMAGLSLHQCSKALGVHFSTISKWFARDTSDMQRLMKTALTKDALIELPKSWARLKSLRDSKNEETCRKAALDSMRAAGLGIDPGPAAGGGISINAQNLQFNHMSVADLDRKILEIAERLGPDAIKLAEVEVRGKRHGNEQSSVAAVGDVPSGQPVRRDGEAHPDGGVPGTAGGAPAP